MDDGIAARGHRQIRLLHGLLEADPVSLVVTVCSLGFTSAEDLVGFAREYEVPLKPLHPFLPPLRDSVAGTRLLQPPIPETLLVVAMEY